MILISDKIAEYLRHKHKQGVSVSDARYQLRTKIKELGGTNALNIPPENQAEFEQFLKER